MELNELPGLGLTPTPVKVTKTLQKQQGVKA
jgi:hypothetical protein